MHYDWQRQIAQATVSEWFTVAAYAIAALCTAAAAIRAGSLDSGKEHLFWWSSTILLVLLAFNDVADLQTLLTEQAKIIAIADGWYESRRTVQFWFILSLMAGAVLAGAAGLWLSAGTHAGVRIALAGLGFIVVFVIDRAASFHHLDEWLGSGSPILDYGAIQEMIGIAIVGFAAALYTRESGKRRRR